MTQFRALSSLETFEGSNKSVAIIGAGSVGSATAAAIIREGVVGELMLVDVDAERCAGEVLDLSDSAYLKHTTVRAASLQDAGQADLIIVTAGAKQRPGEPRTELIDRNIKIISSIMDGMKPFGPDTIVLMVANPVDLLTCVAQRLSGLPHHRVIGSGTFLDSMRLRGEVGNILGVDPNSVHLYVVGEHGDTQVAAWKGGMVGGIPLTHFKELGPDVRAQLAEYSKRKAYEIIQRKGATYFGIAACAAQITRAVVQNHRRVMPLSTWNDEHQIYLSQPCVVTSEGALRTSLALPLSEEERAQLEASVKSMRSVLEAVDI